MRITVFGAAGNVGSRTVAEGLARGHEVTAVVRDRARAGALPEGAVIRVGDASSAESVAELSRGQDLVITATRPPEGAEKELAGTTRALLDGVRESGVRLILVGGAATLELPGSGGVTLIESPNFPAALLPIAEACAEQLELCRAETAVDWTYLSPPALLEPGERTGKYRLGGDELLTDAEGNSAVSMEDFALALLDEAERPAHRGRRFTVAY
ncbi:NAD(P)H-binding protein [Streptomyces sp. NA04227]|uniref:NAD(P)-dependent oxidoreductase n=1 Tax=Streptomyces sp. NA04227 TaxID=2742136 RepID=UPI0015915504|nr:NAD(P)H-binding protein [Streptomyces sp. NA04227]QKW07080.1 NAD(P)H-binding protein [Streptomyces sp. NA04227]